MGKTVSKQMLQTITTFIGARFCNTDNNSPCIELSCDLNESEKTHIAKKLNDNYCCVLLFIYADEDRTATDENYCDLEVIYRNELTCV